MSKDGEPYMPANRTDGDDFERVWCAQPNELNPYKDVMYAIDWRQGWDIALEEDRTVEAEERERAALLALPISFAIDTCDASDEVKDILRRIAEHVGME